MALLLIILLSLTLVQSLFGVGLLLFGTPLLLALGYEYTQALLWLLPASAALSWSQVWELRQEQLAHGYRPRFWAVCIPLLLLAMAASLSLDLQLPLKWGVLVMLCLAIVLRLHERWNQELQHFFSKHLSLGLGLTGLIHGLSNMGGSVLTVLAASLYAENKRKVLAAISLDYACMASSQLALLLLLKPALWQPQYLLGSALALAGRYLLGRNLFALTQNLLYQRLITLLLACNAGLLSWTLLR